MPLLSAQVLCCDDCGPDVDCAPLVPGCDDCECPHIALVFSQGGGGVPVPFVVSPIVVGNPDEVFVLDPGDPNEVVVFSEVEDGTYTVEWTEDGVPNSTEVEVNCDPPEPPQFFSTAEIGCKPGSILGSGDDLRVVLLTRGGGTILAEINPDQGGFDRRLDDTSELQLTATVGGGLDASCCEALEEAYTWATEILVYRDGRDVWVGPVTNITFEHGKVSISASDLSAWWDRRVLGSLKFIHEDLTDIFVAMSDEAMSSDTSPNLILSPTASGIYGDREVNGSQYDYARDHLQELANTGVDWTAYSRTIIVGPQEIPIAPYVTFLDEHFTVPPVIQERGNDKATVVIVKGKGVTGIARDEDFIRFYGEVVRVFEEPDIDDQATVDDAAQSRLEFLRDPIFVTTAQNATLKTTAPITLAELIPGIRVRLDSQATCRKLVRDFRLDRVDVSFDGSVSISLQPLGTVDVESVNVRDSETIGI